MKIILKKNEDRRIKNGHLWVFSNEIAKVEAGMDGADLNSLSGENAQVFDFKDNYIGSGFYNPHSLIAVRILSSQMDFDLQDLLKQRLISAYNLRKTVYPNRNSYRLVFSESDFLPGLIIDKYNDTYVLQIYCFGMDKNVNFITDVLRTEFGAKNIFTKNEEHFRKIEGLSIEDKIILGEKSEELISDEFISYKIDFSRSQKTGFYFDQCDNREFFGRFCEGKTVLDCFCNSGGFGLHASLNKAESVTFVDSSGSEIESVRENFRLNNFLNKAEFIDADVFDYLEKCVADNKKFDIVNIDPPAFAKNKKSLAAAIKGYTKLNRLAMQVLNRGGILFTSSCSFHLSRQEFLSIVQSGAAKVQREIQLLHFNSASLDHPELPGMNETSYLKFGIFKVL